MLSMRRIVTAVATLFGIYIWISYRMAAEVTTAERLELDDTPADFGCRFEHVRFRSRRGDLTLDGWYLVGRHGMPVIIFVHGISSTRTGCGMTELASMLNSRGFGALMFDLRGHGRSGGDQMSGGWHERLDVLGAFDYLRARGVRADSIGLLGLSLGAAAAALAAAEEPQIRAAVLDCPFARASELIDDETALRTPLPAWLAALFRPAAIFLANHLYDIDVHGIAPEEAVKTLDFPLLVIAVPGDDRVPAAHAVRVYQAAPVGSVLWTVNGVQHCEAFSENKDDYTERVADYFTSRL